MAGLTGTMGGVITRMLDGDVLLMDREDLAAYTGCSTATIRARCEPARRDYATGRALYNADACKDQLADVPKRRRLAK